MRGWLVLGVVLLTLAVASPVQAKICTANTPWGTVEYECDNPGSDPVEEVPDPWWADARAQMILGIVGLAGSAGAGGYAIYRVRTRRRALSVTLAAIEATYVEAKHDPESGIAKLAAMRVQVRAEHQKGRLDDIHFLELDRRASQYLVKLRLLEIDRRFATLPPLFLGEIRRLLSDGVLSTSEADLVEVRAAAYRIGEPVRSELIHLTRRWANEDAAGGGEPAPAAPVASS